MTYKYEDEVREMFERIKRDKAETKDELRRRYQEGKLANLKKLYPRLRRVENRVLSLIRRVDYANIKPTLWLAMDDDKRAWEYCRHVVSNFHYNGRLGRMLAFFCIDENTGGILGIIELNSDLNILPPRDQYIGWTKHEKYRLRRLNFIANVGTCVGIQPFGTLTGGKFMLLATLSGKINDVWTKRYCESIAAVTTTSLYGKSSIYNRIKEFEYLGTTQGVGVSNLTQKDVDVLRKFANANELTSRQGVRGALFIKNDIANRVASMLKIDREEYGSKAPKGVYFGITGNDALDFLRGQKDTFNHANRSLDEIRDFWLERWYAMRYPKKSDEINTFDASMYQLDRQIADIETRVK